MNLEEGKGYVFRVSGDGSPSSITNSSISLHSSNGDEETEADSSEASSLVYWNPRADDHYFVEIGGTRFFSETPGTYEVDVIEEVANWIGTTGRLATGSPVSSRLEHSADSDWFRADLEPGFGYVFTISGDGTPSSISNASISLNDRNGDPITEVSSDRAEALTFVTPEEAGRYFVEVGGTRFFTESPGTYVLEMTREIASGIGTNASINVGGRRLSEIEHGEDSDWFRVTLQRDQYYEFVVEGDGQPSAIATAAVAIHDQNGDYIDGASGDGAFARIGFTPDSDGVYYVRSGSQGSAGSPGTYVLRAFSDITDSADIDRVTRPGEQVTSRLHYGRDQDGFAVNLDGNVTYELLVTGDGLRGGVDRVRVERWDFGFRPEDVWETRTDTLTETFTPTSDGTYYFYVGNADGSDAWIGNYAFSIAVLEEGTGRGERLPGSGAAETIRAKAGDDSVFGRGGPDALYGQRGADTLEGGRGPDRLDGGPQPDRLKGQLGDDLLDGAAGRDRLLGGPGGDTLSGGGGGDTLLGGRGRDRLDGEAGADVLRGGGARDVLDGSGGGDRLFGEGANDRLLGRAGRDRLEGDGGRDTLLGGGGNDRLFGEGGRDLARGGGGRDRAEGGQGGDRLFGQAGADRLLGEAGFDRLFGGGGSDRLLGQAGNDRLFGGGGGDRLVGGPGRDVLVGGRGDDALRGGNGPDTFVFAGAFGRDIVTDFDGRGPAGDGLRLAGEDEAATFRQFRNAVDRVDGDLVYDRGNDGDNVIVFRDLRMADIGRDAIDFA